MISSPASSWLRGSALALLAMLIAALVAGPLLPSSVSAQGVGDRRVFAYFYYWYEQPNETPRSIQDQASLSLHAPTERPAGWWNPHWYKDQLADMGAAGIDVALAVYWGQDLYPETSWSTGGLPPMVQALNELADEDGLFPTIGLFLDTYLLEGAHLTEPEKLEWLAEQIKAFYRLLPSRYRATEDGRPIIWLYVSNYANSFDQETFGTLGEMLEPELGARPFWVAEVSWSHATRTDQEGQRHAEADLLMPFDAFYEWGAASRGTFLVAQPIPIASLGPGYDDTAIEERGEERSSRSREDGCFYARSWLKAQTLGAHWVVIETWNELYEGSAVAETAEWGREYIDATTGFSQAFKADEPIMLPAACPAEAPDAEGVFAEETPLERESQDEPAAGAPTPTPDRPAVQP